MSSETYEPAACPIPTPATWLLCLDGSPFSEAAESTLRGMVRAGDSVHVVSAVPGSVDSLAVPSALVGAPELSALAEFVAKEEASARQLVSSVAEGLADLHSGGVNVTSEVLLGVPKDAILGRASAADIDIVVVGSRGHGTIKRALLGSISTALLHQCGKSILVVRSPPASDEHLHARRWLVGVDDSNPSRAALEGVLALAGRGEHVFLAAAFQPFFGLHDDLDAWMGNEETRNVYVSKAVLELESQHQARLVGAGLQCEASFRIGDPRTVLLEEATANKVDVIVVGTRSLGSVARMLLGSTATHVIHNADDIPAVFVIRDSFGDDEEE